MYLRFSQVGVICAVILTTSGCLYEDLFTSKKEYKVELTEIVALEPSGNRLVRGDKRKVEHILKNGLVRQDNDSNCVNCTVEMASLESDSAAGDSAGMSRNFSQTTTQEVGVDEADRVKYDGDYFYIANREHYYYLSDSNEQTPSEGGHLRILKRNDDHSLTTQSEIVLDEDLYGIEQLYVAGDRLLSIANVAVDYSQVQPQNTLITADWWYPYQQQFQLDFLDVSDRQQVTKETSIRIDGYPVSSRRIGNKVYILSTYANYNYVQFDSPSARQNQVDYERFIADTSIKTLPEMTVNGVSQPFVQAEDCYLPESSSELESHSQVTTLTTFDLTAPEQVSSICVLVPSEGIYVSTEGVYLYGGQTNYDEQQNTWTSTTHIHHFAFAPTDIKYIASGEIPGLVGWQNSHLRFSEYQGDLRVVATENRWNPGGREHKLHILRANQNNGFDTVSMLPNASNPAKIGKPEEDIFAVRYFGDKAYVVTFRNTDPLYVINLEDPQVPFIEGELEIPGFSSYLHPLNDNFIVGIGREVDPNLNTEQADPDFVSGAKIELYDVSNPEMPIVAGKIVFPNTWSVAGSDYHALTVLKTSDNDYKFSFPVSKWQVIEEQTGGQTWYYSNLLQLIDVNLEQGGSVIQRGEIDVELKSYDTWGDRAVLHDDVVYYLRTNSVWQSYWSNSSVLNGPF